MGKRKENMNVSKFLEHIFEEVSKNTNTPKDRVVAAYNKGILSFYEMDMYEEKIKRHLTSISIANDSNQKAEKIKKIKDILTVWGGTSCAERELNELPCLNSIGTICEYIEEFNADGVETVVCQDDKILSYFNYDYEKLPEEIIDEILEIVEDYETDMLKTEKRCQS